MVVSFYVASATGRSSPMAPVAGLVVLPTPDLRRRVSIAVRTSARLDLPAVRGR
jgi:hypothetical protein